MLRKVREVAKTLASADIPQLSHQVQKSADSLLSIDATLLLLKALCGGTLLLFLLLSLCIYQRLGRRLSGSQWLPVPK